ncbi:MAG: sugar phosphate isomerase/epimerase [Anaerolineae bacterium]|nr:sugar phosphate isomerase/epimerase [Anaerolineae bacterium]
MQTRTGGYPIGFRRGWSDWQKDLNTTIQWAIKNELEVMDLGKDGDKITQKVIDAGLRVGSVDLAEWQGMISPKGETRAMAVERNASYIEACAAAGVNNFFIVMLPERPDLPRAENFDYMVESFAMLAPTLEANHARIVIEGWPGPGALCCTPEGYRALFQRVPSPSMGINYDPSHLIRMGIDPLRFLREFANRVYHVHGKDTELFPENAYEYGHEQPPTFAKPYAFGSMAWRYTIPGHGVTSWVEVFRILKDHNYQGMVSVELEDQNFNGTETGEKLGITLGAQFLKGC